MTAGGSLNPSKTTPNIPKKHPGAAGGIHESGLTASNKCSTGTLLPPTLKPKGGQETTTATALSGAGAVHPSSNKKKSTNAKASKSPSPDSITARCQMTTATTNICKKASKLASTKGDPRLGPSPFRQLLPIALCVISFATVLSILIVYMDTTEIRHQQFRLNMSRDYELIGVSQDDPTLVEFIREIHMKRNTMNFLKNAPIEHLNFTERHELTPEMAHYVADLVGDKTNGAFIQSMTGQTSNVMTAPWLAETLNWSGLIVEPEPRRYFSLRKSNFHRPKIQVVHACLSPNIHPKEITIHNDEDVRINSLIDEESAFNSRVKCFPLYTLMLAVNRTEYDLLSLGCPGYELQILQTLPFNKVNIEVISIHLTEIEDNQKSYIQSISKFLLGKSYKLQRKFENNYIYRRISSIQQATKLSKK